MCDSLIRRLRRLGRDESGQSALFAVVTMMLLVIVIGYTYNVGFTVSQRARLQNAADAAAYSGAVVEANALSAIAWLNSCETYLHSRLQEHMLDVVTYTTASAICEWGRFTKADSAGDEDRDAYEPSIIPHFFPIPGTGFALPPEVFGKFVDLPGESNGWPPAAELNTAFGGTLYSKLASKYGVSVSGPGDVIKYTELNSGGPSVYNDAVKWIADHNGMKKVRRGEMWMRQLSQVAAGIARALPEMVRDEVLYSVAVNGDPTTHVAIFPCPPHPDGGTESGTVNFSGEPALIQGEGENPLAFFKYDAYSSTLSKNRFLAESRRQAMLQGFSYVGTSGFFPAINDDVAAWWDEVGGEPKSGGTLFEKYLTCWNKRDRYIYDESDYICPVGYAPGPTSGSELAHPRSKTDAADGHWHFRHGHSHSEDCTRSWGGICLGWASPWCLWKCLFQEIAGSRHHMQYLNHETKFHWTGVPKKKNGDDWEKDPKHVYCDIAVTNRSPKSGTLSAQYPDILPGMRNPKICFFCDFKTITIFGIPFIICTCKKCSQPKQTSPNYTNHRTQGCRPAFLWEYVVIMPPWDFFENWPKKEGQKWPGHFYTKADWEARFSGDPYYYDLSWALEPVDTSDSWSPDFSTGFAPLDKLVNTILEAIIPDSVMNVLQEIFGRFSNWAARKGHHCFMVCPLCHKECPLCGEKHFGKDKDGDQRSDCGLVYADVINNGHDYSTGTYGSYDLGLNVNDGDSGSWKSNMCIDRFVREWWSPRDASGNPVTSLAPTVMVTENFMRFGVTVALWSKHRTYFFSSFFGTRTGHVALATARAGFVERSADGYADGSPAQIVTGAGELRKDGSRWTLDKVWDEFLDFPRSSKTSAHSNLYCGDWGAKLVSVRDGILPNDTKSSSFASASSRRNKTGVYGSTQVVYDDSDCETELWLALGATYTYRADGTLSSHRFRALVQGTGGDGDEAEWTDFVSEYLAGRTQAESD